MLSFIQSLFVEQDTIVNLHWVDAREDEDVMTHERVFIPCPVCKRSRVMGYAHKH